MGYTHYWRQKRDFTVDEWAKLQEYTGKIVEAAQAEGINLANGMGEVGTNPDVNQDKILLNGSGPDACESFYLARKQYGGSFFCKTNEQPYDPVVVTILVAAHLIAPDTIEISSDGGEEALVYCFTNRVKPPTEVV